MPLHRLVLPPLLLAASIALALAPSPGKRSPVKQSPAGNPADAVDAVSPDLRAAISLERQALQAWAAGDPDSAARAVTELATRWPGVMPAVHPRLVRETADAATAGGEARIGLLQALVDAGYAGPTDGDGSWFAYELALERLLAGDPAAARAALAGVDAPEELLKLRIDRRFDGLLDDGDGGFDAARAARRHVDRLRAKAFLDQQVLELQVNLGMALLVAGDVEDALALAQEVEDAFAAGGGAGWRDPEQRFPMRLVRWQALLAMGRDAEVEADLAASVAAVEPVGGPFPRLLLAGVRCSRADYARSLATLPTGRLPEDITGMLHAAIRVCAASQSGHAAEAADALAWLRAHRDIDLGLHTEALVQAGELDAAAADVIARLRDPRERAGMLLDLQGFRRLPTLPGEATLEANWRALRARADVQAAIEAAGRVRDWPVYKP